MEHLSTVFVLLLQGFVVWGLGFRVLDLWFRD